jgi:hypothetical protein
MTAEDRFGDLLMALNPNPWIQIEDGLSGCIREWGRSIR